MSVSTGNKLKGHMQRTHLIIFITTGRTESAPAAKSDEFHPAAMRTAIESPAFGIITAIDHLGDIFNDGNSWMKFIKDVFVMIRKNRL